MRAAGTECTTRSPSRLNQSQALCCLHRRCIEADLRGDKKADGGSRYFPSTSRNPGREESHEVSCCRLRGEQAQRNSACRPLLRVHPWPQSKVAPHRWRIIQGGGMLIQSGFGCLVLGLGISVVREASPMPAFQAANCRFNTPNSRCHVALHCPCPSQMRSLTIPNWRVDNCHRL